MSVRLFACSLACLVFFVVVFSDPRFRLLLVFWLASILPFLSIYSVFKRTLKTVSSFLQSDTYQSGYGDVCSGAGKDK